MIEAPEQPSPRPRRRARPLWVRLAALSIAGALLTVALTAGLAALFTSREISRLVGQQRDQMADAIATAAGTAWDNAGGWAAAELTDVFALAARDRVQVQVYDRTGPEIAVYGYPDRAQWTASRALPVTADGQQVGLVIVRFTTTGLGNTAARLKSDLLWGITAASGLAAALALTVGVILARWIARPIEQVAASARAMSHGDRDTRVGDVPGAAETQQLAAAFDAMADAVTGEEQLRRDLVADVFHELRNPIAVLQAGYEALLDDIVELSPESISGLHDHVLRLARLVKDLQHLTATEAAALRPRLAATDLAAIAAEAAQAFESQLAADALTLETELSPAPVQGDERLLQAAITNLLSNAVKFSQRGGRITLRVGPVDGTARIQVADTGRGIPQDELPHIFERFYRGRNTTPTKGSGIGLTIVDQIIRAHHGAVSAESEPGHGATITITLPRDWP